MVWLWWYGLPCQEEEVQQKNIQLIFETPYHMNRKQRMKINKEEPNFQLDLFLDTFGPIIPRQIYILLEDATR